MPADVPSILGTILNDIDSFSTSERRIAEFVLENQDAIILNQADLAAATDTSAATVSRFCRHLGLKGYREFQTVLYGELLTMHGDQQLTVREITLDDVPGSLQLVLETKMAGVSDFLKGGAFETLGTIAHLLADARSVFVAGIGKTIPCAIDAAYKFSLLGIRAETSEIYEKQLASALCLGPQDLVYLISASGFCPRLLRVVAAAHERGAKVVVITGNGNSPMARQADVLLVTTSNEKALNSTFGYSITNYMLANEMLYLLLASSARGTGSLEDNLRFQLGKGLALGD